MIFNSKTLTTPESINQYVASFCRSLSAEDPVYIDVEPELWCKQSNCEMNVDKFIAQHGGEKIIGYKIWYIKRKFIEAERHIVYRKDGKFRDLTFNEDGEDKVLFVHDNKELSYNEKPLKIRIGLTQRARIFVKKKEEQDVYTQQLSQDDSWNIMITYEEWLAGKRKSNKFFVPTDD
ncbi:MULTISPECIES: hypothetical protein [Lonsdalea]|uniref:Uncharacterized protein n=2 Tax=Lonsdalea TaxID=1082702 RepID=A0ACD1JA60_9GAMM|nr:MULTISPECIES: hypothetical protein [Lonsdalea]RAT10781.1 hypothetical protein AU485_15835 [Lonsdalea quercina]RAT19079.1 hypothetical protein AU487_12525 [Lonsdalea populi]RAT20380.1 hypothetical protein AU489_16285 [Lonsdalea populi]RAT23493.1 hypothetical protein AU488_09655 [Lonsdalea populi]RAT32551.1 hypothetical protein AU492_12580 [Lonsdalea populi]